MVAIFKFADGATPYAAGTTIFAAGDQPGPVYVVQSGEIEVRRGGEVIERLGPGGVVGEMALLDHAPRSATIVVTSDRTAVVLDERAFLALRQPKPLLRPRDERELPHPWHALRSRRRIMSAQPCAVDG